MFKIPCPYCHERSAEEFAFHGEAHIKRPENSEALSDEQWVDYLFLRDNPKGWVRERLVHVHGCGRWFNVLRNNVTNEIRASYEVLGPLPQIAPPQEDQDS